MALTLEQAFSNLISRLSPLLSEREKSTSHKGSVKSCLQYNFACSSLMETGSFGNGTGVRHYSDTDYFAICPTNNLSINSGVTLRKMKECLQARFSRTSGIIVNNPAVQIPFGNLASETLEVTPAKFVGMVNTPIGNFPYYSIPSYNDLWMQSSPSAHNKYVRMQDERLMGRLKPLIQLVKAWKYCCNVPITSFYLELRITKYAEEETSIIYDIDILRVMRMLNDIGLAAIRDPLGVSGMVPACSSESKKAEALSKLNTALNRAAKAFENKETNPAMCFYWWNIFFNGRFPSR